jgi:hypothetical protein
MAKAKVAKQAAGILGRILGRGGDDAVRAADDVAEGTISQMIGSYGRRFPGGNPTATVNPRTATSASDIIADVTKGTRKPFYRNPRVILPLTAAGGIAAYLASAKPGEAPAPLFDPSKIDTGAGTADKTRSQTQAALDAFLKQQEEIIRQSYATPAPAFPGAEVLNPASAATTQMGAATLAEMQQLAARAAQDAGAIRQGGVTGAASINDIYGGAATTAANLAAAGGGEYGGLTPVSGAEAVAPAQTRAAGAALGDYLRQNQLISAQDQGFLSELSGILGTGYANQFAMQDATARAALAARQQQAQMEFNMQREAELRQALAELGLTGAEYNFKLALEDAQREAEPRALVNPAELNALAEQYNDLSDNDKDTLAIVSGIFSATDYINAALAQGE